MNLEPDQLSEKDEDLTDMKLKASEESIYIDSFVV